jgi:O-methyltransferase domain
VLKDILHDWDDARCGAILERVSRAMTEKSVLLVPEMIVERCSTLPPGPLVDVQMLMACDGGRQRSEAEHAKLLQGAGLRLRRVHTTATAVSIVEAERA